MKSLQTILPSTQIRRRRVLEAACILPFLPLQSARADVEKHFDQPEPNTRGATTRNDMTAKLSRLLAKFDGANLDSKRLTVYDAVLPSDMQEYQSTGGCGLLLISAATRDKTELPIARVYALVSGKITPLTHIASQFSLPTGPRGALDLASMAREDSFYLLPVDVATTQGVLLADFSAHRSGFTVAELPVASNDAIRQVLDKPTANLRPDATAVRQFLDREYQGFRLNFDNAH